MRLLSIPVFLLLGPAIQGNPVVLFGALAPQARGSAALSGNAAVEWIFDLIDSSKAGTWHGKLVT